MGCSLFNVGRKLTPEEWGELKAWRAANPDLRWKRGDAGGPGRRFWGYAKGNVNGEAWCSDDQLAAWRLHNSTTAGAKYRLLDSSAKERLRADQRRVDRHRRKTDHQYAVMKRVRARIAVAMAGIGMRKECKTGAMLGCSFEELEKHLEAKFLPGMTWENRSLWHIDHIIPLSSAADVKQLVELCHYSNLQPLWAADNFRKGAKMPHELLG